MYRIITLYICFSLVLIDFTIAQDDLIKYNNLFKLGKYTEAASEIDRLISAKADNVPAEYYLHQAEVFFILYNSLGKLNIDYLIKSQNAIFTNLKAGYNPNNTHITKLAGDIAREFFKTGAEKYNAENFKSAQDYFTRATEIFEIVKNFPDLYKLYFFLAMSCQHNKDIDNAIKYFKVLVDNNYSDQNIYLSLSDLYKAQGKMAESVDVLKKIISISGTNNAYYDLILTLYSMNDKQQALEFIRQFNADKRYDSDISMIEGSIFYEMNETDSAIMVFKKIISFEPEHINANFNAGIILYNTGLKIMKEAEEKYYDSPDKYRQEKDKYLDCIKSALPYLETAYKMDNNNTSLITCLSDVYKRLQRNEEYESLQKAINKNK